MTEPVRAVRFAHISDLHVGKDYAHNEAAARTARTLLRENVDRIVLTGDVTQKGARQEGELFEKIFERLLPKLTIIPGNHDRGTDNYANRITGGDRVWVQMVPRSRLYFICCDSTSPWNGSLPFANGFVTTRDIEDVVSSAKLAPKGFLVSVLLHHHVLKASIGESPLEVLSDAFRLPFLKEVDGGADLLAALPMNVQMVLHGHKHVPSEKHRPGLPSIYNGGSTTELGAFRVFSSEGSTVVGNRWITIQ